MVFKGPQGFLGALKGFCQVVVPKKVTKFLVTFFFFFSRQTVSPKKKGPQPP
jgi:hypothetical protein